MKQFLNYIKEDFRVFRLVHPNKLGFFDILYLPSFKIVLIFRLSQLCFNYKLLKPFAYFLTVLNDFLHGVWIGAKVKVGKGFFLGHPRGLVVNPNTTIGDYCAIIQQVSIGGPRVFVGNNVSINAGAKIISDENKDDMVIIGDDSIIAAGAVVLKSMPNNSVIAGMPAKVVKTIEPMDNWISRRIKYNNI